jgi:non-lysosomal glucosylceramidase
MIGTMAKSWHTMAEYLGDTGFASECQRLFELGSKWTDAHLFNGQYYQQEIRPPQVGAELVQGLEVGMGAESKEEPDYQMGSGCLVDQLAGQLMAHVCGLDYLLDEDHVRQTLESIMKYNFQEDLYAHFNHMRTFALNDESGLLMCTFPLGNRPKTPVPYFNELMTGFEYTAAVHMLYEGMIEQGLRCIKAIRSRYDGHRRNPFDEAECGHHYARAMTSWAAVLALTGFRYSGVSRIMEFAIKEGTFFWSTGYAWGTLSQEPAAEEIQVRLRVLSGDLWLSKLILGSECEHKIIDFGEDFVIREGNIVERIV